MNVLLFNASPKKNGATQEILAIMKEQISTDVNVDMLCLGDFNIAYCLGEKCCYETCTCIQEDDMQQIIDRIDQADKIVIVAPSYWADVPGQFKVFIDRCTPYSDTNPNQEHRKLKAGKVCYAVALRTGTRPMECEHIIDTIKHWCGHMKIEMPDSMYFCGINDKADIGLYQDQIAKKAIEWFL